MPARVRTAINEAYLKALENGLLSENKLSMRKSQKRIAGDVVRISLGDGFHAYACVLGEALFAFYDSRTIQEIPVAKIVTLPILFQVAVMDHAVKHGRWVVVGHTPLDDPRLNPRPQFMQDIMRTDQFDIYERGGRIRSATKEECVGLERASVWEPTHVEERLRDHYAGRKNKWLEALKIKD